MKKILWCGGSHLFDALPFIRHYHSTERPKKIEGEVYVTAGPENAKWSVAGGRYHRDGSCVGLNAYEPNRLVDLATFDLVVFVGQYIQSERVFSSQFDWTTPLSSAVLDACLEDAIEYPVHLGRRFYNEPLVLFPSLSKGKVLLFPDPCSMSPHLASIDANYLLKYQEVLKDFCCNNDIMVISQPEHTIDNKFMTKSSYQKKDGDYIHLSPEFWRESFEMTLVPAINKAVAEHH